MNRLKLLFVLAFMPEEAFGYFVGWARGMPINYPDGLGGFQPMSRDAIVALRAEAEAYVVNHA
jgi:hypothetical protein